VLSPEVGETITDKEAHITGSKASRLAEAHDETDRRKTEGRHIGSAPEKGNGRDRVKPDMVGGEESLTLKWNEVVKGR
jgi:hypothetical protein